MYYTYIIYGKPKNLYYTGSTHDLKTRIRYHRSGLVETTKSFGEIELVWYGAFKTKKHALLFERYLKSSSGFAFRNKRLV